VGPQAIGASKKLDPLVVDRLRLVDLLLNLGVGLHQEQFLAVRVEMWYRSRMQNDVSRWYIGWSAMKMP
jgi:hypothetical protein